MHLCGQAYIAQGSTQHFAVAIFHLARKKSTKRINKKNVEREKEV